MTAPNPNRLTEEEWAAIQTYRGALRLLWSRAPFSTVIALVLLTLAAGLLGYGVYYLFLLAIGEIR